MSRYADLVTYIRKNSKLKGSQPRVAIEIAGISKYLATHKTFTTDSRTFDGLIKGASSISRSVNRLGGLAKIGGMEFSVINQGLFSNVFTTYPDPENEPVNAWLYFDDGTDILDAEREQLFEGEVSIFPDLSYEEVPFICGSSETRKSKPIGTILTDSEAADTGKGLPEESAGKIDPVIYGSHEFFKGNDTKSDATALDVNNLTPCVYLGLNSSGNHVWRVASHLLNESAIADVDQTQFWGFDKDLRRFVRLDGTNLSISNTSAGCELTIPSDPYFYDYWYGRGTVTTSDDGSVPDHTTEHDVPENIIDKDFSDESLCSLDDFCVGGVEWTRATIPFPPYDNQNVDDDDISAVNICYFAIASTVGAAQLTDGQLDIEGTPYTLPVSAATCIRKSPAGVTSTKAGIALTIDFTLECVNSLLVGEVINLNVYQVYKEIKYQPREMLDIYFGGKGREYDTWINSRTQDETHIDNNGSGNLIENAAGVVESLLRDELGFADANIDLSTFNVASNDLTVTKLSFAIVKQVESDRLLDDMLQTVKSVLFPDYQDVLSMRTFVAGDGFGVSENDTPAGEDIFDFSPTSNFTIASGINDKIDFDEGSGELTATLTSGSYTGATLAAEIETRMEIVGALYTVSYSLSTGKFTIAKDTGTVILKWATGTNSATTVGIYIGFDIDTDDIAAASHVSDWPVWDDSYFEHPISRTGFILSKTQEIYTDVTVQYYLSYVSREYQKSRNATDNTYHAETIAETWVNNYTRDQDTVDLHRDWLLDRHKRKYWRAKIPSPAGNLSAIASELWDFTNHRHPVINGILGGTEKTQKWLILDQYLDLSSMRTVFSVEEV